jgi:DNA-binding XRE family transcriptional regulator
MTIGSPKLPDITSKTDFAVFGLGYAAGFAMYAFVFRLSTPPPITVALVVAIAALAIKSGIQAWQERESPPKSEQERQEDLRNRLIAFEELFSEGTQLYKTGRVTQLILDKTVSLERQWEPNPNYEPHGTEGEEGTQYLEPQYIEREVTDALYQRVLVLHVLWKAGIVTDAYADARLDELSDLCSRKASIEGSYRRAIEKGEDSRFGDQLMKLMSDKGVSRAELSKRAGFSMARIIALESSRVDPKWSTVYELAEALEVDLTEFVPRRSDGSSGGDEP